MPIDDKAKSRQDQDQVAPPEAAPAIPDPVPSPSPSPVNERIDAAHAASAKAKASGSRDDHTAAARANLAAVYALLDQGLMDEAVPFQAAHQAHSSAARSAHV